MKINPDFLGDAFISSNKEKIQAGSFETLEMIYKVGKYGIDDTGEINIVQRSISDWEYPQFKEPKASGYTTITTDGKADLEVEVLERGYVRPWRNCLKIKVIDGYLQKGDQIKVIFGDKSQGSPGIKVQSFCESVHKFKILVDPFGTGNYNELPDNPIVEIVPGPVAELQVIIPSLLIPDEDFDILVRCLDSWGNPTPYFQDTIHLKLNSNYDDNFLGEINFFESDEGFKKIPGISVKEPGVYWIQVEAEANKLKAVSNRAVCKSNSDYKLFWGDLHGQTEITIGTGSLEEYFEFAQGPAALDFCSWQGNDFQITDENWNKVKEVVKKHNNPGNFITFLGYEWSGLTAGGGDHNIYFLNDDAPLHRSSQWLVNGGREDDGSDRYPISQLWKEFKNENIEDVLAVAHVGGRYANFDFFDPQFVKLIEVHSHHGTFEWFIEEAIERNLRIGFIAGSDDHSGRPGLSYPTQRSSGKFVSFDVKSGYVAIYAHELTRESIWQALKERRCYATTSQRIFLDFRVNDNFMGQEAFCQDFPELKAHFIGTEDLQRAEIMRGNQVIYRYPPLDSLNLDGSSHKIIFTWSGVRKKTRNKKTHWDGNIRIKKGRIISAEEFAIERKEEGISFSSAQIVEFSSTTSGDFDGMILEIEGSKDTVLAFNTKQINFKITLDDISNEILSYEAGGVNQKVEVFLDSCEKNIHELDIRYKDNDILEGINPYWIKVIQQDGNQAWSSPIYVNYKSS